MDKTKREKMKRENKNEKMVSILFQHSNQTINVIKQQISKLSSANQRRYDEYAGIKFKFNYMGMDMYIPITKLHVENDKYWRVYCTVDVNNRMVDLVQAKNQYIDDIIDLIIINGECQHLKNSPAK